MVELVRFILMGGSYASPVQRLPGFLFPEITGWKRWLVSLVLIAS